MAFDQLLNMPMSERVLLAKVAAEIQRHYSSYQSHRYFLKLEKISANESQIIWVKSLADKQEFWDFIFDTEFERSCILIRFEKGKFVACCFGFHYSNQIEITEKSISEGRPTILTSNRENEKMIDKELLARGFRGLAFDLKSTKGRKAV